MYQAISAQIIKEVCTFFFLPIHTYLGGCWELSEQTPPIAQSSLSRQLAVSHRLSALAPPRAHWAVEGAGAAGSGFQRLTEPGAGLGMWVDPNFIVAILPEPEPALWV